MGKDLFYRQLETGIEAAYQLAGQTMACNMIDEVCAGRRAGVHGEAQAELVSVSLRADSAARQRSTTVRRA